MIFCVIFLGFAYLFLPFKGKNLVINKLKGLTGRNVTLGYISYIPPFKFQIRKLDIQGLLKADKVLIFPNILGIFYGKLAFDEIRLINPEITYEKNLPVRAESAQGFLQSYASRAPDSIISGKGGKLDFIFRRMFVSNGKITIFDHTVGKEGIKITVKDISLSLINAYKFPQSVISKFDFKGNIPWIEGRDEGRITARGWVDLLKRDITALLKIEGIDGVYLYPYYAQWIDIQKSRVEKAKLNFTSNIHGFDNNVTAECHLELDDIVFKPRPAQEPQEKQEKIVLAVLDIFKSMGQGKVVVDFTFRTQLDRPVFGFQIIKGALEDKIANSKKNNRPLAENIAMFPADILEGVVLGAADISKALIYGSFSVGNEFKRALQASFRKKR